jgi:hypothetical protein
VPEKGSLDAIRKRRAEDVANAMLKPTTHSMKLEAQGVSKRDLERQRKALVDTLLSAWKHVAIALEFSGVSCLRVSRTFELGAVIKCTSTLRRQTVGEHGADRRVC